MSIPGLSSVVCCRHSEDLAVYCVPASVLSMAAPSRLAAAAEHISKADALLICTGAGMGVDSGRTSNMFFDAAWNADSATP